MVLLSSLAMHPVRSRSTRHAPPSSSSSDPKYPSPVGYPHTNGYFYSPSHSEDAPSLAKGFSPSASLHQPSRGRRNSGPTPFSPTMTSPLTSPGVYSSLTSLDVWSPTTVSVASLLAHAGDKHNKINGSTITTTTNNNGNDAFVNVNGGGPRPAGEWGSDTPNYSFSSSFSSSCAATSAVVPKDRSLRRSVSADPNSRDREQHYFPSSRPLGSPHEDPGIPRVCSDGDLLESEYVTLDYTYKPTRDGSKDSVIRGSYSDNAAQFPSSESGNYRRYYSDESNYYYVNGYSSGYVSNGSCSSRSGSGSTGSLQRSGTLPTSSAMRNRTMSAERLWTHHRATSSADRGWGTPPRKKSSQTLQTVAENFVQGTNPGKSILKNGNSNNNNNNGSGTNTPRSASSSRRSSITSRQGVNGSQDSCSIISSDFANNEPSRVPTTPTPLQGILVKHNNFSQSLSHTAGGIRSSSRSSSSKHKEHPNRLRLRSKSLSDLRLDNDATASNGASGCYSDDEDGDDFGFLSHPSHAGTGSAVVSRAPTAMHKAKSAGGTSSPSHRLLPRRWRTRGKTSSTAAHPAQPMWTPEVSACCSLTTCLCPFVQVYVCVCVCNMFAGLFVVR